VGSFYQAHSNFNFKQEIFKSRHGHELERDFLRDLWLNSKGHGAIGGIDR
jgi:hypothetical protein